MKTLSPLSVFKWQKFLMIPFQVNLFKIKMMPECAGTIVEISQFVI